MQQSNVEIPDSIRSAEVLEQYLYGKGLSWDAAHLPNKELFSQTFPVRIPRYYADLIEWQNLDDPLRKMVIPDERELQIKNYELSDPIGDHVREAVPGLIHRYPDRCLLLLTSYCLVHCRFCFRREVVGKARPVQFQAIQKYLSEHHEVQEIIFSGGDPFTFPVGFLQSMQQHLGHLSHIQTWRFHSRIPAIDPQAVSHEWIDELRALRQQGKQVVIVIHINHPREITQEFRDVAGKLRSAGCIVLSQSVMLRGINTELETFKLLFRGLVEAGVKPYYLHHLDQVLGSHHFRISIEEGKKLYTALRGNLSSICIPEYVLDLPGGMGKVPVMWMEKTEPMTYEVTNFEGKRITYPDQADAERTPTPSRS